LHRHANATKSEGDAVKVKKVVTDKELFNTMRHLALGQHHQQHTNTTGHDSDLLLGDDNGYERNGGRELLTSSLILMQQKSKTRDRAREEGEGVLLAKQGSAHGRVVEVGLVRESRQVLVLPSGSRSLRSP